MVNHLVKGMMMLNQVSPQMHQNSSTGPFDGEAIYTVKLKGNRELRYKTAYELGYIVGSKGLDFDNPYDPINLEEEEYYEGLAAGIDAREKAAQEGNI